MSSLATADSEIVARNINNNLLAFIYLSFLRFVRLQIYIVKKQIKQILCDKNVTSDYQIFTRQSGEIEIERIT